ncbi:unnamed protein product, partial [Heterotrigona itama]
SLVPILASYRSAIVHVMHTSFSTVRYYNLTDIQFRSEEFTWVNRNERGDPTSDLSDMM